MAPLRPATGLHPRIGVDVPVTTHLGPVRVVTVNGTATVRPIDHDAPARVIARAAAHNDREPTEADILARARAKYMPEHLRFWRVLYDGIRVFAVRDGLPITPEMAWERANNQMAGITGTYTIAELQPARTNAFAEEIDS